jgi:hypothetical protein
MADKETLHWTDGHGRKVTREVRLTLDIRDFEGMAGYPWLVMAANPHLSGPDILRFLRLKADEGLEGAERNPSWIARRRWMFQRASNLPGTQPDADGKDARALSTMREYPTLSARKLSRLLKEKGIDRSREWVRRFRCYDRE